MERTRRPQILFSFHFQKSGQKFYCLSTPVVADYCVLLADLGDEGIVFKGSLTMLSKWMQVQRLRQLLLTSHEYL